MESTKPYNDAFDRLFNSYPRDAGPFVSLDYPTKAGKCREAIATLWDPIDRSVCGLLCIYGNVHVDFGERP
jgi:hypothetical protein